MLGRPRGLLSALIAAAPTSAIAVKVAYDDTLLSGADPTSPAAVHQGHQLALVVLGCVAAAVVLRALLLALDRGLEGEDSPIDRHRRAAAEHRLGRRGGGCPASRVALGAPGAIAHRWNQFVNQPPLRPGPLVRNRLSSTSNDGRIELWTIAVERVHARTRSTAPAPRPTRSSATSTATDLSVVVNAHSLYIETLGELGLVGLAFVALFVLGTLVGLAPFGRGRDRALYAALFAAGLAWALHAGVDWDWQMPAVSLWFAALGGLALGRPAWRGAGRRRRGLRRASSPPVPWSSRLRSCRRSCSRRRFG